MAVSPGMLPSASVGKIGVPEMVPVTLLKLSPSRAKMSGDIVRTGCVPVTVIVLGSIGSPSR